MASSVWRGHLTFGLVSFPVRLFSAARSETVSFNLLHKADHSRIKQVIYCQAEEKPVPRNELVKGYEYEKDRYVEIDEEDIKKVAPKTAKVMEIQEFVKAEQVDPIYLESSYYVAPDEGGEKPYALLFQALRESKYYALAKVAMHSREHLILIRPYEDGLMVHTLFYAEEVKRMVFPQLPAPSPAELKLAGQLIAQEAGTFNHVEYADGYAVAAKAMLAEKVAGKKPSKRIKPAPKKSAGDDLMAALQASLAVEKKKGHALQ